MATEPTRPGSGRPNLEFVERCQIEYDRNPASRVFAPLCEAYRKMGLIKEALELAQRGVNLHPDFAAGRIAYARILIEQKKFEEAIEQLTSASELSPDNILAFQLLGEAQLELRKPKEALNAFKMVLLLNPLHDRAQKMVRKWEFLTADEFSDDDFNWSPSDDEPLPEISPAAQAEFLKNPSRADREAHRALSLADALTVRNDLEGAFATLGRCLRQLGPRPDIEQRLNLLGRRLGLSKDEIQTLAVNTARTAQELAQTQLSELERQTEQKKKKLTSLLKNLKTKRT